MKNEITNLIIAGATPIIAYGVYKYYSISTEHKITQIKFKSQNESPKAVIKNNISIQTDEQCFNEQGLSSHLPSQNQLEYTNNLINSPNLSKKNSIISSRTSSVVDLSELDNNVSCGDEAHMVESISETDNYKNNSSYIKYFKHFFVK